MIAVTEACWGYAVGTNRRDAALPRSSDPSHFAGTRESHPIDEMNEGARHAPQAGAAGKTRQAGTDNDHVE